MMLGDVSIHGYRLALMLAVVILALSGLHAIAPHPALPVATFSVWLVS
jgi:hypothetical protein